MLSRRPEVAMLEKLPHQVGEALHGARAGVDKIVSADEAFASAPAILKLTSPAFTDGGAIPALFTEDGAKASPPLSWSGAPPGTQRLVLITEDPDAPTPEPLTHLIAWDLPADDGEVEEGGFAEGRGLGRNSFLRPGYLPPDPPPGHGPHRYVFQLFAVDAPLDLHGEPGKGAVVDAMRGRVLARGRLVGTYERS
jgi:Raf kinase inhibitor-like YbhB/YbcL family protein